MEQTKTPKKHGIKLLYVVSGLMVGMSALIIIVMVAFLRVIQFAIVIAILGETLSVMADRFSGEMEDYKSLPWLLSYWEEHEEELDLDPGQLKDEESDLFQAKKRYLIMDIREVTPEEAAAFSEENQRLFAEYCYIMLEEEFKLSSTSKINIVDSCFRPEGEEGYIYFYNECFGNTEGITLGSRIPVSDNFGTALSEAEKKEEEISSGPSHFTFGTGEELFYDLSPVQVDGQTVCVVICGFEKADVEMIATFAAGLLVVPLVILLVIFQTILLILLNRMTVRPARIMQMSVQRYTETKNSEDIREGLKKLLKKKDEYGRLSGDISEMADSIDHYIEESKATAAEKQRLSTELETAETIQKSQLPSVFPAFPERSDFDLYALMDPAKEVGGDFYDFFLIDEDHIALVIGDVSDKGIPAALLMMACRTLIRSTLLQGIAPAEAMMHVNRRICETNAAEMFVTVWVTVIELSTGKGIEINAGHEKPVLRRAGESFAIIKNPHDMAIGMWEEQIFTEQPFELHPGDTLFVYSDGVPEATSEAKELFGPERMLDALNEKPDLSPEEQIRHMEQSVNSFVGDAEQFDDMTMLCFVYKS